MYIREKNNLSLGLYNKKGGILKEAFPLSVELYGYDTSAITKTGNQYYEL